MEQPYGTATTNTGSTAGAGASPTGGTNTDTDTTDPVPEATQEVVEQEPDAVDTVNLEDTGVLFAHTDGETSVTEGGFTDTYSITLKSQPINDADVIVDIAIGDQCNLLTANPVTIPNAQWNIPIFIEVQAIDDLTNDGDRACDATHSFTSADPFYNGALVLAELDTVTILDPYTIPITVLDNDIQRTSLLVDPTQLTLDLGETGVMRVSLSNEPATDVRVIANSTDADCILLGASLTLTPTTWNQAQEVTVTSFVPKQCTINFSATSDDGVFNDQIVAEIPVTVTDIVAPVVEEQPTTQIFEPSISKVGILQQGSRGLLGERVIWEVIVSNDSNATGNTIVFTDTVQSDLQIDNVSASIGTVTITDQVITVDIGTMNPSDVAFITIETTVLEPNITVDNTACVDSADSESICVSTETIPTYRVQERANWMPLFFGLGLLLLFLLAGIGLYVARQRSRQPL